MKNLNPICSYCGQSSQKITGKEMYPHRSDLYGLVFYKCFPCNATVGTHKGSDRPLGTLANSKTKQLRSRLHSLFDPLWKSKIMGRSEAYKWLASEMNIDCKDCHIGMFDNAKCEQALTIINQRNQ